jgi:hypothetical protein
MLSEEVLPEYAVILYPNRPPSVVLPMRGVLLATAIVSGFASEVPAAIRG